MKKNPSKKIEEKYVDSRKLVPNPSKYFTLLIHSHIYKHTSHKTTKTLKHVSHF